MTFDANGGSDVAPQLVVDGEKAVRPEGPTLIGYTLDGWYINGDEKWIFGGFSVTEDITLVAHWRANEYTITFDPGLGTMSVTMLTYTYDDDVILPIPTYEEHYFLGWLFEDTPVVDGPWRIAADVTLTAQWIDLYYDVYYDFGYDELEQIDVATYGIEYEPLVVTRTGYSFDGWYDEDDMRYEGGIWTYQEDLSLLAKWTPNTYTVTLNPGSGTLAEPLTTTVTYDASYTLPVPVSTKEPFQGWVNGETHYTDATGASLAPWHVAEDVTLDAVYYYAIATPEQLVAISSDLAGVYKLEADIDLASAEWTPIGTNIAPFTGVFLGQGFIISNLAITVSQSYVGLFGYNGGTISDLCLNGVTINVSGPSGSNIYAGAFIGYNAGSVASLHTLGGSIDVLLGSSPLGYAGGLIGYQAIVSTLDDLSNNADIFGGGLAATGGLVGYFTHSSNNITLTNSDNTGLVDGSSSHVGGLFGFAERIAASYCHNTAGISGTTKVGGLVGDGYRASFIWCSNSGTISGSNSYIGGIIGTTVSTTSFQFTQNSGPITGVDYVGGMIGRGAGLSVNFSSNSAAIIGRNSTGGLVGFGHSTSLTNCRNTGLVTGQGAYVGGLIGSGYGQTIINNVTNAGQVSGSQLYVGGIIGYAEQVIITRAINSGGVSSNSYNTGGLIGGAVVPITVICSVNFGAVAATGSSGYYGGIAGYYPTATIQQTYYTGTIVSSGVIVTGTAAGTKVTDLSVMNLSFFTSQLGYNQNMWDFSMLDVPNGFYPTLVMPF